MSWTEERVARLCLGSFPGFGSRTLRKLWAAFLDPQAAWLASGSKLTSCGISEKVAQRFVSWRATVDPASLVERLERDGISVLFKDDPTFPSAFRHSSDPPEILFVRGTLRDVPAIAIVGTRRFTQYGKRCVDLLVPDLARSGLLIVSGLALGIDTLVHRSTLEAGGYTVAILGGGVDDDAIYPRENFPLAKQILSAGGAMISEFPPGAENRKEHFPMRNRLIASLSSATLVIEGAPESGSMITAKLALEENREVLAVPGPIWSEASTGTNQLLKLGAKVCTRSADVLEALSLDRPELMAQARLMLPLDPIEEHILTFLTEPQHVDELGRLMETTSATISGKLALLELKGLAKPIGGQMWVKGR
ncbi:MAG: DNA-processing protein DprA [Candidatus Uhrbacteria bacterium]|nr:DNA-processing protein DprA [Candidatus Uhrbacteria bacterium]